MLNGTLKLHDIRDCESLCASIAHRNRDKVRSAFAQAGRHFGPQDDESYIAYLLVALWRLSNDYRPGGLSFCTWATHKLGFHVTVDFLRDELGRTRWQFDGHTYERTPASTTELDNDLVGATDMDPAERSDSLQPGLEPGGDLSAAAYFPPRDLWPTRGTRRPPDRETDRLLVGQAA